MKKIKALIDRLNPGKGMFQGTIVSLTGAETSAGGFMTNIFNTSSFPEFINSIFTAAIAFGAMAAVLRIVYAGFLYMTTTAGGEKTKAKNVLRDTFIGLLLLLGTVLILQQINPDILNLDITRNVSGS